MGKVTWLDVRAAVGTESDCQSSLVCGFSTSALTSKAKHGAHAHILCSNQIKCHHLFITMLS